MNEPKRPGFPWDNEPMFSVLMHRKDKEGRNLPVETVRLSRVPTIGEHVVWAPEDWKEEPSRKAPFRVVHVAHVSRDPCFLQTAMVFAVEDGPWAYGVPTGWED